MKHKKEIKSVIYTLILFIVIYGIANGIVCAAQVKLTYVLSVFALGVVSFVFVDGIDEG